MDYYAGIDVSLEASSICVLDASGKIVREAKLSSEPEAAYPVDSGSSICSGVGGSAPLRGLSRFMMSQ